MHTVKEAIIVEGTYDQIRLSNFLEAVIIKTNGFTIFKDKEKIKAIKTLAKKTGIVILTDSDSAGFKIRNFIKQSITDGVVKHAYIPDIHGKEKRKTEPSKEGLLGVEGISDDIILEALKISGCELDGQSDDSYSKRPITKADLFILGLSGGNDASKKRNALCTALDLPLKISSNMLIAVLNKLMSYEQLKIWCEENTNVM